MIFRELIGGKYLCDVTGHYLLLYCLCGIVGPWVTVPKALEEDSSMWVYGVGPAPRF